MHKPTSSLANPWTIGALNGWVSRSLEHDYRGVWVTGEISNLASARYGHRYFSLKDAKGQIACVWFLHKQRGNAIGLKDGLQVVVQGTVSLYGPRGTYQIQIEQMHEAGYGALQQAFEALKKVLLQRGWFEDRHKKPLPLYPATIGVISSPSAAAFQDILSVLKARYPMAHVILYPSLVQGAEAPDALVKALELASEHGVADVLVLARGGGSLEDLWAFNEEKVAKAVFDCPIPIVTGVGHEVDTTIVDWVADRRAPTPSAAAEMVVPQWQTLLQTLSLQERHLQECMVQKLSAQRLRVQALGARCVHPQRRLSQQYQLLQQLWHRLQPLPGEHYQGLQQKQLILLQRLNAAMDKRRLDHKEKLLAWTHRLEGLSPLATLQRGYAHISDANSHKAIRLLEQVHINDVVLVQLAVGSFLAKVQALSEEDRA